MASAHETSLLSDEANVIRFSGTVPPDAIDLLLGLVAQLEQVHRDSGLRMEELIDIVDAADRRGAQLVSELTKRFLAGSEDADSEQQVRAWEAVTLCLARLAAAYICLVSLFQTYGRGWAAVGERLPMVIARALRVTGSRMKWMRLRYQPVGSDVWKTLSRLWSYVEDKGLMRARVFVYDDLSTLQRELTKPLMFAMSAADSLSPPEIDVVDRLISHLAGRFNVQRHPGRGCGFVVDIHQWSMPGRYRAGDEVRLGSRFFGPGDAIADLETISAQLAAGDVSNEDVNLEGVSDLEMVIDVMAHLERHWSVRRPERREQRERASSSMSVVLGYAKVVERIADDDNSVAGDVDGAESWGLDNESEAGYGALVAMERGEQLDIGELVGIRPSDRRVWAVGVIRRLAAQDAARRYVGIELLARGVQAVGLNDANSGEHIATGLLLLSHTGDSTDHGEIRLLLPGHSFSAERAFEMIVHNKSYLLQPLIVIETGDNYEVGRFQVVDRAA